MWRDLGMSLPLCWSHWFASQKFALILPRTYSSSHEEKKKLAKFIYVSSIIPSYLKLAKLHTGFSTNPCFLKKTVYEVSGDTLTHPQKTWTCV